MIMGLSLCCFSCKPIIENDSPKEDIILRHVHDTIGFAQYDWQMDSIYNRLGIIDTPNC